MVVKGFDNNQEEECANLICTHPGENATCSQERAAAVAVVQQGNQTTPTTGTLTVNKVCVQLGGAPCSSAARFPIEITGNNNPQPSTFTLTPGSSQLVTLGPGTFTIVEQTSNLYLSMKQ